MVTKDHPSSTVDQVETSSKVLPQPKCTVYLCPDGTLRVDFLVEIGAAKRLLSRAGVMPLDKYIWENILKRAIDTAVY